MFGLSLHRPLLSIRRACSPAPDMGFRTQPLCSSHDFDAASPRSVAVQPLATGLRRRPL